MQNFRSLNTLPSCPWRSSHSMAEHGLMTNMCACYNARCFITPLTFQITLRGRSRWLSPALMLEDTGLEKVNNLPTRLKCGKAKVRPRPFPNQRKWVLVQLHCLLALWLSTGQPTWVSVISVCKTNITALLTSQGVLGHKQGLGKVLRIKWRPTQPSAWLRNADWSQCLRNTGKGWREAKLKSPKEPERHLLVSDVLDPTRIRTKSERNLMNTRNPREHKECMF